MNSLNKKLVIAFLFIFMLGSLGFFVIDKATKSFQALRIAVNNEFETSLAGVWSGGDCVKSGEDLTVQAVEDGKQAANSINQKIG